MLQMITKLIKQPSWEYPAQDVANVQNPDEEAITCEFYAQSDAHGYYSDE